jgi:hypothetical protein
MCHGEEIGKLVFNPITKKIAGEIHGYSSFGFETKGLFFWRRLIYSENGKIKYIFKANWHSISTKDKRIEMKGHDININGKLLCELQYKPKDIFKIINQKPLFLFELSDDEYLPFVFAYSGIAWNDH